jgi:hypothetical protein
MKNLFNHLKTSSVTTTSGMLAYNGSQYIASSVQDSIWKTIGVFVVTLGFGIMSKLILDKVVIKKEN